MCVVVQAGCDITCAEVVLLCNVFSLQWKAAAPLKFKDLLDGVTCTDQCKDHSRVSERGRVDEVLAAPGRRGPVYPRDPGGTASPECGRGKRCAQTNCRLEVRAQDASGHPQSPVVDLLVGERNIVKTNHSAVGVHSQRGNKV